MKKIFILFLILAFSYRAYNQVDTPTVNRSIQPDYLKKSRNQKTVGWVFLGTGTAMIITGGLIGLNSMATHPYGEKEGLTEGILLVATGIILDLASIPLFVTASQNKRKAATVSLKNDVAPKLVHGKIVQTPMPSISVRVSF